MGDRIVELLEPLRDVPIVGEIRNHGMMIGIELVTDRATREPLLSVRPSVLDVVRAETAVIVRDVGQTVVLSPPLVLEEEQAERAASALVSVLQRVRPDGTLR